MNSIATYMKIAKNIILILLFFQTFTRVNTTDDEIKRRNVERCIQSMSRFCDTSTQFPEADNCVKEALKYYQNVSGQIKSFTFLNSDKPEFSMEIQMYYDSFEEYVILNDIKTPDDFCLEKYGDQYETCTDELKKYGNTKIKAIKYALYSTHIFADIKLGHPSHDPSSSEPEPIKFVFEYITHMTEEIKVNGDLVDPWNYCRIYWYQNEPFSWDGIDFSFLR